MIICKGLQKSFGQKQVIRELDLEIKEGTIFGLVGRSGCGKSTLLKILLGVYNADAGSVTVQGKDITHNLKQIRKLVGYTTQENSFYDKLTLMENMRYYGSLYGVHDKSRMMSILQSVGLAVHYDSLAGKISGGMKRRLDFAISLIHNPSILILDEPTTGLDPILVRNFWKVVLANKKDRTVIVSSHIFSEIEEHCDEVGIMNLGKIIKTFKVKKGMDLYKIFEKATL